LTHLEELLRRVRVLREVSLSASRSEVLGIAGENGAGKSTLMNILGASSPRRRNMVLEDRVYLPRTRPKPLRAVWPSSTKELISPQPEHRARTSFSDRFPASPGVGLR